MTDQNTVKPPEAAKLPYDTLFIFNDRGGTRKSTFLIFLWALLLLMKRKPLGFEIDQQSRLARLYKQAITTLVLADVDEIAKSALADTVSLAPLLAALGQAAGDRPMLVEIGANMSERVAAVIGGDPTLIGDIAHAERKIALALMIDELEDTIVLGCRAARLLQHVLPMADIVLVQRDGMIGLGDKVKRMSREAQDGYESILIPAIRAGRVFTWPDMSSDVRRAFEVTGVDPISFRKLGSVEIGKATYLGANANDIVYEHVGRRCKAMFELYLADLIEEAEVKLGFRIGKSDG